MFKRVSCLIAALVVLASVIVIPTYASQSITVTADWPALTFTYVDDPDDPFEEFKAYASVNGSYVEFWTSASNDLIVIPDEYLHKDFNYFVRGSTALGTVVGSNIVTYYGPQHPLPRPGTYLDLDGFQHIEWDRTSAVESYADVKIVIKDSSNRVLYRSSVGSGSWIVSDVFLIDALLTPLVADRAHFPVNGATLSCLLEGYNSYGTLVASSATTYFTFVDGFSSFEVPVLPNGLGPALVWQDIPFYRDKNEALWLDTVLVYFYWIDTGDLIGSSTVAQSGSFALTNNLVSGPVDSGGLLIPRGYFVKVRFNIPLGLSQPYYLWSAPVYFRGLDNLGGDISTVVDQTLYDPPVSDLQYYVPLMYSGVTQTPVYKYVFSGLVACLPFVIFVFLINKVH